jgi:hypothetical protein
MNQDYSSKQFTQFRPMVEQAAWRFTRKYKNLEYEEIKSQAYLAFCEVMEKFDLNYFSYGNCDKLFSTYLYNGLRNKLRNYCYIQTQKDARVNIDYRYSQFIDSDIYVEGSINIPKKLYSYDTFIEAMNKIDNKLQLSDDARDILNYICSREWEVPGKKFYKRPSKHFVTKLYRSKHWKVSRINSAWNEIAQWWQNQACMEV